MQYEEDGTPELYVRYTYDENGSIIGFSLWYEGDTSWTVYYFLKNLQGDVIQIYKASDNTVVAEYTYDSWGNVLSATGELAELNPFRYRGYYYDVETGFYYLTSRYYDPKIGRFLNSDTWLFFGNDSSGTNLFSYCGNNPASRIDQNGNSWVSAVVSIVVATVTVVVKIACTIKEQKRVKDELDNMPEPTEDISNSFHDTLKDNADTIKKTKDEKGIVDASKQFYNNVRNKGEWDLKQKTQYQGTFLFNGRVIQGQDIGNINFGYTGKALGLPDSVLLVGAGVAQMRAGTSNFYSIMVSNGDDLRDQMYIRYGIQLYKEDN